MFCHKEGANTQYLHLYVTMPTVCCTCNDGQVHHFCFCFVTPSGAQGWPSILLLPPSACRGLRYPVTPPHELHCRLTRQLELQSPSLRTPCHRLLEPQRRWVTFSFSDWIILNDCCFYPQKSIFSTVTPVAAATVAPIVATNTVPSTTIGKDFFISVSVTATKVCNCYCSSIKDLKAL